MVDTQWPRFEVFQQDRAARPHRNIGSVHAPDPEMALLNARDVFARRPATVNLWVVPETAIFSRTAEELAVDLSCLDEPADEDAPQGTYYVFHKRSQRRAMSFVDYAGQVTADRPDAALARAIEQFDDPNQTTYVWWVCPEQAILCSEDDDVETMFAPANDKHYRLPREYRVVTQMMEVKRDVE